MMSPVREALQKNAVPGSDPHAEFPLQDAAVYGPIRSRRLGLSLGINPLPVSYKLCDFDCVYCQYGWTPEKGTGEKIKPLADLLGEIDAAFSRHALQGLNIKCLTIAGNGEPTLYPYFHDFVKGLLGLRDLYLPGVKIGILSDSSQIHRPRIRQGLELLDERYMKLDAGTPERIAEVNRPRGDFNFERMRDHLKSLPPFVIQSLFIEGSQENTNDADVNAWIQVISEIRPAEVQVYTIDRRPADPGLKPVSQRRLNEIARACEKTTGISSIVFD
jgi:wyosine [tRNA(Phe)-imidazoG37] synthetase (radical SAM superfamily)